MYTEDETIAGLTAKPAPVAGDELPIWSVADASARKATIAEVLALAPGATAPTIAACTDVDDTTQAAGKVLAATPSDGKPYSWITPASGGGGGGSSATLDAVIRAEASLIHYWPMDDAAGATGAADAVGGVALPVNGDASFGAPPLVPSGHTSLQTSGNANSYLTIPAAAHPSLSGPFSVEMLLHANFPLTRTSCLFSMDASENLAFFMSLWTNFQLSVNAPAGTSTQTEMVIPSFKTVHFVWSNSAFWIDGIPCGTFGGVPTAWGGNGALGCDGNGAGSSSDTPTAMRVGYLAFYDAALTAAQVQAHFAAAQIF